MILFKQISKIMVNTLVLFMFVSPLGMVAVNAASSTGTVVITVTDSSGKALSNATVDDQVNGTVLNADSSGQVTFTNLTPGTHPFVGGYRDWTHVSLTLNVTANKTTTGTIVLTPPPSPPPNNQSHKYNNTVKITVGDGCGIVLGDATVSLKGTKFTATTNSSGVATMSNLPPGSYVITASCPGYYEGGGEVNVPANGTVDSSVDCYLAKQNISIQAADSIGNQISTGNLAIMFTNTQTSTTYTGNLNRQGQISPHMPPGQYTVTLFDSCGQPAIMAKPIIIGQGQNTIQFPIAHYTAVSYTNNSSTVAPPLKGVCGPGSNGACCVLPLLAPKPGATLTKSTDFWIAFTLPGAPGAVFSFLDMNDMANYIAPSKYWFPEGTYTMYITYNAGGSFTIAPQ
jgi:hypothetical protein